MYLSEQRHDDQACAGQLGQQAGQARIALRAVMAAGEVAVAAGTAGGRDGSYTFGVRREPRSSKYIFFVVSKGHRCKVHVYCLNLFLRKCTVTEVLRNPHISSTPPWAIDYLGRMW